jgi:hypothetical protein
MLSLWLETRFRMSEKYDFLCRLVRDKAQARGAIVIIFDGAQGSGVACQTLIALPAQQVAAMLRRIAADLETKS